MTKRLLIVGHGRAGKDTALDYLAKITTLRNGGTTSLYLCEYVAKKLGLPTDVAYQRRHESDEMRTFWYNAGNELRQNGPTTLIRMALEHGEMTGGVRDYEEIFAAKREGIVDLIIWIDNNRVKVDPTVKFSEREADIIIPNHWSLEEFHERLARFARCAQLPMRDLIWTEGDHLTWGEFKQLAEQKGIENGDRIHYIDISHPDRDHRLPSIGKDEQLGVEVCN